MNSRELTLSAIEGTPEKIPFNPYIMHLAASLVDVDYSKVFCQNAEVLASAQIKCANFFGIDHVNVSTDAYREASAWGVELSFDGHTPVAKNELKLEDFESIEEPDLLAAPRIQNRVDAVRLLKERVGSDQCVVGWIEAPFAEVCCLFGVKNGLLLVRKPAWKKRIATFLKRILPVQLEFAQLQIEAGADIIGAGDSAVSLIGPQRYEESCLKATQELFRSIKKHVPVLYHTCGDNSGIDKEGRDMLKLIASSGASILDIDFQVDLRTAKAKIGNQICIRGNTDTNILGNQMYTPEKIINEITRTIEAGKPDGRYMFAAGCEWPWEPIDMAARNLGLAKALTENLGGY